MTERILVTVCDRCLQASCWQGEFYCSDYKTAGTVDLPIETLEELALESPSYWGMESSKCLPSVTAP